MFWHPEKTHVAIDIDIPHEMLNFSNHSPFLVGFLLCVLPTRKQV